MRKGRWHGGWPTVARISPSGPPPSACAKAYGGQALQGLPTVARDAVGGEEGIRTPGSLSASTVFKTAALNHSATSPRAIGSVTSASLPTISSVMIQNGTSDRFAARLWYRDVVDVYSH